MAPKLAAMLPRSQVELTLQSHRFLFRPIELPSRATEFLGGIVRAQIDRLTPWSASEAMFGWSQPVQNDTGQIEVSLAATSRDLIEPYVNAIANTGAHSISVFASAPAAVRSEEPIKVWEENVKGPLKLGHIRQVLVGLLAFIAITFGISIAASALIGRQHEAQRQDIEYRISSLSSAAQAAKKTTTTAIAAVRQDLAKRKNENLSSVIVLEILSRILPDHTYLSEFRMEGNKMRLVGVTKDAPSLVALMEQSRYFSQAKFFAPTTRSPSNARERFHIEATIIQPLVSDRS